MEMIILLTIVLLTLLSYRFISVNTYNNSKGGMQDYLCINEWKGDIGYEVSQLRFIRNTI